MRNAFADEITNLAIEDDRILLLSGDIGNRLFDKLKENKPSSFMNCGVAEANMIGVAAGLALSGLVPIVYTITPFITTRCLEQLRVDVAYHEAPVIIVGTGSGLSYASLGPPHHSLEDFAIFKAIPNIQVLAPWDPNSLRQILTYAIESGKPTYIRIGKKGEKNLVEEKKTPPIGRGYQLQSGKDICILAVGTISHEALSAIKKLKLDKLIPSLFLLHTVKPFAEMFIDHLLENYKHIIIVEEHSKKGGVAEDIAAYLTFKKKPKNSPNLVSMGTSDQFLSEVGSQNFARTFFNIDSDSIVKTTKTLFTEDKENGIRV